MVIVVVVVVVAAVLLLQLVEISIKLCTHSFESLFVTVALERLRIVEALIYQRCDLRDCRGLELAGESSGRRFFKTIDLQGRNNEILHFRRRHIKKPDIRRP
jgi:hypothetical protein